jgi:hypothetical protein
VSELCQIPLETSGKHRDLREHAEAPSCCGKSLMESALVRVGVRQHARTESISKRAPSSASARVESSASYGEMSRRSGDLSAVAQSAEVEAAKADNHSDISPRRMESAVERDRTAASNRIVKPSGNHGPLHLTTGTLGRIYATPSHVADETG